MNAVAEVTRSTDVLPETPSPQLADAWFNESETHWGSGVGDWLFLALFVRGDPDQLGHFERHAVERLGDWAQARRPIKPRPSVLELPNGACLYRLSLQGAVEPVARALLEATPNCGLVGIWDDLFGFDRAGIFQVRHGQLADREIIGHASSADGMAWLRALYRWAGWDGRIVRERRWVLGTPPAPTGSWHRRPSGCTSDAHVEDWMATADGVRHCTVCHPPSAQLRAAANSSGAAVGEGS